jgi:hypothetical protein
LDGFLNFKSNLHFLATLETVKKIIVTKNVLGKILGDFVTNSPGHPGPGD